MWTLCLPTLVSLLSQLLIIFLSYAKIRPQKLLKFLSFVLQLQLQSLDYHDFPFFSFEILWFNLDAYLKLHCLEINLEIV